MTIWWAHARWLALSYRKVAVLCVAAFAAFSLLRGCAESNFSLLPESRLPKWFSLPGGYVRGDVTVRLTYYTRLIRGDDVVLDLVTRNGQRLARVTGRYCWHPAIDQIKRNLYGGFDVGAEPRYVVVRAKGTMEVIEHPLRGPIFQLMDDPVLVQQAIDSLHRGECRRR